MTIDILWMAGTGHGQGGDGVSDDFHKWLTLFDTKERFSFRFVPYPADFGMSGHTYRESVEIGEDNLIEAIGASPNDVIVGGYSQGAEVAGEVGRRFARTGVQGMSIRGVIMIADPWRPEGVDGVAGYGVRGARGLDDMPALWASNPGDPITALPEGNPLRALADIATLMGASVDPVRKAQLWNQLQADVRAGRLQRWWDPKNFFEWGGALAYGRGYLFDGRHTDDYVRNGLTAQLAGRVVDRRWTE